MQPKTPLFTSGCQHPPRFGHAVYLGDDWGLLPAELTGLTSYFSEKNNFDMHGLETDNSPTMNAG